MLEPQRMPLQRPTESRLDIRYDIDDLHLRRSGSWRWSWGSLGVLTFLNLFWNGIVSVFVYDLTHEFQWFLFFFLIPFEAIGLLFLAGWVALVLAPVTLERWVFGLTHVTRVWSVLGLGLARRREWRSLRHIELRSGKAGRSRGIVDVGDEDRGYVALCLVDADGADFLVIRGLFDGEARWIADELYRNYRHWFAPRALRSA